MWEHFLIKRISGSCFVERKDGLPRMREEVEKALEELRPSLQADGGDVELVGIEDSIVKVRLTGACAGCPMSEMTLKQGVETYIRHAIPEITAVEAV